MAVPVVVPQPLSTSQVAMSGTPVVAVPANPAGGFIQNPASSDDQGIGATPPENLYVSVVGDATLIGNGNTFVIPPGGTWEVIAGQSTPTSVNATTAGHRFAGTYWPNT